MVIFMAESQIAQILTGGGTSETTPSVTSALQTGTGVTETTQTSSETATSGSWVNGFDDDTKAYVANKGWDSIEKFLESYRNIEKFNKGNTNLVEIPGPDADEETINSFYERIGRPSNADSYGIEFDDDSKESVDFFTGMAHKHGLTRDQAQSMYNDLNGFNEQQKQAAIDRAQVENDKAVDELKTQWGKDYDANISAGTTALQRLGIEAETIDNLEEKLGTKGVIDLMVKIGKRMGEPDFIDGSVSSSYGMTPAQARLKMSELKTDPVWMARYLSEDNRDHVEQMKMLMEIANNE